MYYGDDVDGGGDNFYAVSLQFHSPYLGLYKWKGSESTQLGGRSLGSLNYDEWYRIEVDWGMNGHHWIGLYDKAGGLLTRIHGYDDEYKAGGLAIYPGTDDSGATATYYVDSLTMPKSGGYNGSIEL